MIGSSLSLAQIPYSISPSFPSLSSSFLSLSPSLQLLDGLPVRPIIRPHKWTPALVQLADVLELPSSKGCVLAQDPLEQPHSSTRSLPVFSPTYVPSFLLFSTTQTDHSSAFLFTPHFSTRPNPVLRRDDPLSLSLPSLCSRKADDNTQPFHNPVEKDAFGALLTASFAQALAQPPFSTTSSPSSPFQAAAGAGGPSSAYYDLYNQQHPLSTTELDRPLQKNEGHEEGYVGQMQLGVGSFQHFEHALGQAPSAPTAEASTSTVFGSHESLGEGDGSTQRGDDPFAAMNSRKTSVGTAASDSSSVFEDSPHGPLGGGGAYDGFVGGGGDGKTGEGGLLLLQRDMASILRLDVQQSGVLIVRFYISLPFFPSPPPPSVFSTPPLLLLVCVCSCVLAAQAQMHTHPSLLPLPSLSISCSPTPLKPLLADSLCLISLTLREQYELIGLLNESQEVFDRSLAPERQSPAGRERLLQLANYVSPPFFLFEGWDLADGVSFFLGGSVGRCRSASILPSCRRWLSRGPTVGFGSSRKYESTTLPSLPLFRLTLVPLPRADWVLTLAFIGTLPKKKKPGV